MPWRMTLFCSNSNQKKTESFAKHTCLKDWTSVRQTALYWNLPCSCWCSSLDPFDITPISFAVSWIPSLPKNCGFLPVKPAKKSKWINCPTRARNRLCYPPVHVSMEQHRRTPRTVQRLHYQLQTLPQALMLSFNCVASSQTSHMQFSSHIQRAGLSMLLRLWWPQQICTELLGWPWGISTVKLVSR